MSIVSFYYFVFIGIVYLCYWLCVPRMRWLVLFFASAYFMLCGVQGNGMLCCIFAAETLLTWWAALGLKKIKQERVKTWLTGSVIVILLAVLIFYKDLAFFVNNANVIGRLFGAGVFLRMPERAAPFGISYYTLILIGYLLDVRWGIVAQPQKNPCKLLTFAGYFPHMTSGPFTRYREVEHVLFSGTTWSLRQTQFAIQRLLWGLFKKLVVAERLAVMVSTIYDQKPQPLEEEPYVGLVVVMGAFLYVGQVYMDFSGCMDIVIGTSQMLGIPLAENFCRPFTSTSVSEIWRRWHMTLGFWLKDYLLYPTLKSELFARVRKFCKKRWGKQAAKSVPTYMGLCLTWFCVGFWHGGTWKYIFGAGLYFFAVIVGGMILQPLFQKLMEMLKVNTQAWSWMLFQRVRSFCLFAIGVSIGRSKSLMEGLRAWKTVFTEWNPWVLFDDTIFNLGLERKDFDLCMAGIGIVVIVSILQERYGSVRKLVAEQNLVFRWIIYFGLFFSVLIFGCYGPGYDAADFIYGGF